MDKVKIKGKEYPVWMPFMAVAEYQKETGNGLEVAVEPLKHLAEMPKMLFYAVKWGCKAEKVKFDISVEDIENALNFGHITIDAAWNALNSHTYDPTDEEIKEAEQAEKEAAKSGKAPAKKK